MSNKYQYADVISNDEGVFDVHVIGDALNVVYRTDVHVDLSWVGEYLGGKDYEYENTQQTNSNLAKDIFVPEEEAEDDNE